MNKETRVECPLCGRMVEFRKGATNGAGEPVMVHHWRADVQAWEKCRASGNSPKVAAMKRDLAGWYAETKGGAA